MYKALLTLAYTFGKQRATLAGCVAISQLQLSVLNCSVVGGDQPYASEEVLNITVIQLVSVFRLLALQQS